MPTRGSIHTSHRAIVGLAASIYLFLVVLTAVLPAAAMAKAYPPKEQDQENEVLQSIARGRELYKGNGCHYCHTQQIRGDERMAVKGRVPVLPVDRRFGLDVASSPADYASDDPPFLGTQRTGPDLTTVGSRLPSVDWHYWHLYDPRAVSPESVMPSMRWLFTTTDEERGADDVEVKYIESLNIPSGKLFATQRAQDLVAYILSLTRDESRPMTGAMTGAVTSAGVLAGVLRLGMDLENLNALEWVVVGLSAVAAVWVIVRAVKLTLHPGEEEPDHVKRVIFQEPTPPPASSSPSPGSRSPDRDPPPTRPPEGR